MRATAWILDVSHGMRRLTCEVPAGMRALAATQQAARHEIGVSLGIPLGLRGLDAAPEFLFLIERPGGGEGWTPLRTWAADDEPGFQLYLEAMLGGWEPPTRVLDVFHFGNEPRLSAKLVHLVTKGIKRGTTGWLEAAKHDGSPVPELGTVSIVTDGFGYAACAIRTERVERLRFAEITAEHAFAEGEGDRTLEDWREGHVRYFQSEARELGLEFTEDAIVVFEHFRVLAVFGSADR